MASTVPLPTPGANLPPLGHRVWPREGLSEAARDEIERLRDDIQLAMRGRQPLAVIETLAEELAVALQAYIGQEGSAPHPPSPFVVHWQLADARALPIDPRRHAWEEDLEYFFYFRRQACRQAEAAPPTNLR